MRIDPDPIAERDLLPHLSCDVADLAAQLGRGERPPEGWTPLEPETEVAGHRAGGVDLCVLHEAIYDPRTGLVVTRDGRIPASPAEVLRGGPETALKRLGARQSGGDWSLARIPSTRIETATLWMGGGSLRNYGHFLFDSLTALAALDTAHLTRFCPAIAPKLSPWQHQLVARAGLEGPRAVTAPVVIGTAILTTAFGHYLHRSHHMLTRLATRLGRPAVAPPDGATLYLSRRGYSGRIMLRETELESDLLARGVEILRPERLSVAEQAAHMARARTVIGASGAALANMVFLGPGARVIEIRPARLSETWIDLGCANLGLGHTVVPASEDLPSRQIPARAHLRQMPRRLTGRYNYVYDVDPDAVIVALDG